MNHSSTPSTLTSFCSSSPSLNTSALNALHTSTHPFIVSLPSTCTSWCASLGPIPIFTSISTQGLPIIPLLAHFTVLPSKLFTACTSACISSSVLSSSYRIVSSSTDCHASDPSLSLHIAATTLFFSPAPYFSTMSSHLAHIACLAAFTLPVSLLPLLPGHCHRTW